MSTTTCGRWDTLWPANSSTASTLSSEKRAGAGPSTGLRAGSCAATGATTINAEIAEHAENHKALRVPRVLRSIVVISHTREHHVARVGGHARQRRGQGADDLRVELGAVAAQAGRIAAAVRPLVMQLDDRNVPREKGDRAQDARAEHRVLLDRVELR